MLAKTVVHTCRHCGRECLRKNGHANNGAQRAKCLECGRTFILEPKGPRYDQKFKDQVLAAYQDRMSLRGIKRTFGVCYQTVIAWVGGKSGGPARLGRHTPLWSFVQSKAQEVWLWIALLPTHPPDRRLHHRRA